MSPTMIHRDEDRDLVFVWHGGTTIDVFTAKAHEDRAPAFDAIDVWGPDGPELAHSLDALAAEAACYACPHAELSYADQHPMLESAGVLDNGGFDYLASIL